MGSLITLGVDKPVGVIRVQPHGGLDHVILLEAIKYRIVSQFSQFRVHQVLVTHVIGTTREAVFSVLVVVALVIQSSIAREENNNSRQLNLVISQCRVGFKPSQLRRQRYLPISLEVQCPLMVI